MHVCACVRVCACVYHIESTRGIPSIHKDIIKQLESPHDLKNTSCTHPNSLPTRKRALHERVEGRHHVCVYVVIMFCLHIILPNGTRCKSVLKGATASDVPSTRTRSTLLRNSCIVSLREGVEGGGREGKRGQGGEKKGAGKEEEAGREREGGRRGGRKREPYSIYQKPWSVCC